LKTTVRMPGVAAHPFLLRHGWIRIASLFMTSKYALVRSVYRSAF